MPRHAAPLDCSAEVRAELTAMSRSRKEESRMVERACIVLACVEGKEIQQVARETGASIPTVSKWRKRFAQAGMAGLRDQPRSGKPPTYDAGFRDRVLALLAQTPPAGLGHWDGREVARELGASVLRCGGCCAGKESISSASELGVSAPIQSSHPKPRRWWGSI